MERQWTIDFSEEGLAEQLKLAEARAQGREEIANLTAAETVKYDPKTNLVEMYLKNGAIFSFPPQLVQGLGNGTPEQLNDVWLDAQGLSVHWESLDADFSVAGLVQGIFGTKAWMAELGRRGGQATSEAKKKSSRENGKKGGRPRSKAIAK